MRAEFIVYDPRAKLIVVLDGIDDWSKIWVEDDEFRRSCDLIFKTSKTRTCIDLQTSGGLLGAGYSSVVL
jgi:hypothetical protein